MSLSPEQETALIAAVRIFQPLALPPLPDQWRSIAIIVLNDADMAQDCERAFLNLFERASGIIDAAGACLHFRSRTQHSLPAEAVHSVMASATQAPTASMPYTAPAADSMPVASAAETQQMPYDLFAVPFRPFEASDEQRVVVAKSATHNVIVSAQPGSGKTATITALAHFNRDTPILVLTYSKRLQHDSKKRLIPYENVKVYTFHAFASKLFSRPVKTDEILHQLRVERTPPRYTGRDFRRLVVDEIQDMTDLLYWLTCMIIKVVFLDRGVSPQIVVLGDPRQSIYDYKGASERYLTHSRHLFGEYSSWPWATLTLSKSFRLSRQTVDFVKHVMLRGDSDMVGSHDGPKPIYIYENVFVADRMLPHLLPLITQYGPENTAILAPSIRRRDGLPTPPIALITDELSKRRMFVTVHLSDEYPLNPKTMEGKLVVTTFHQFKGCERRLVIVYGADFCYFRYYARGVPTYECTNPLFVAFTRAIEQLVVVHHKQNKPLPFMDHTKLGQYAEIRGAWPPSSQSLMNEPGSGRPEMELPQTISVTELFRFLSERVIYQLVRNYLRITRIWPSEVDMEADHSGSGIIQVEDCVLLSAEPPRYEFVADLSGTAVTIALQHQITGRIRLPGEICYDPTANGVLQSLTASDYLKIAADYENAISGYASRRIQLEMQPYDWLTLALPTALERLRRCFDDPTTLSFESPVQATYSIDQATIRICGYTDVQVRNGKAGIWEIKFMQEISNVHFLQLALYGYLWAADKGVSTLPPMWLYNVKSDECWRLQASMDGVREVIAVILRHKYASVNRLSDEAFDSACHAIRDEVQSLFQVAHHNGV